MSYEKTIGITGARGALGRSLIKRFKKNGYKIIGFSHNLNTNKTDSMDEEPNEWVFWKCGEESLLELHLQNIDILILNHGIYDSNIYDQNFENSIEINSLSKLKIINLFEKIVFNRDDITDPREIWVNTSEAEIFPALSPSYEVSKTLIGQITSFKHNLLNRGDREKLKFRKLVLGPFKSNLNPIGIMHPEFIAALILILSKMNFYLIVISINPLSYIIFPLKEFYYFFYCKVLKLIKN